MHLPLLFSRIDSSLHLLQILTSVVVELGSNPGFSKYLSKLSLVHKFTIYRIVLLWNRLAGVRRVDATCAHEAAVNV